MTAPRLSEIRCPSCARTHWIIESDFRGIGMAGEDNRSYPNREYRWRHCRFHGAGFQVVQQGPPAFFLQPHSLYPMTPAEFGYWVHVFRRNFPRHPKLWGLGTDWYASGGRYGRQRAFLLLLQHVLGARWLFAA